MEKTYLRAIATGFAVAIIGFVSLVVSGLVVLTIAEGPLDLVPGSLGPNHDIIEGPLVPYRKGDKFGYSDLDKNIVIEPRYDYAGGFYGGLAIVGIHGRYGYVDRSGTEVIPLVYDRVEFFASGLSAVKYGKYWGFIDLTGRLQIDAVYETEHAAPYFSEGLAGVCKKGSCGFIDREGIKVIDLVYEQVGDFSDGLAAVQKDGRIGMIDRKGRVVIPFGKYTYLPRFNGGIAVVEIDGKWGAIDRKGDLVVPAVYCCKLDFSEGLAVVKIGEKFGFINKAGQIAIAPEFERALSFSEGLAAVRKDGLWGYIDPSGRVAIDFKFPIVGPRFLAEDGTGSFQRGLARVEDGFIDREGSLAVKIDPVIYRNFKNVRFSPNTETLAVVVDRGKWMLADRDGTLLSERKFFKIGEFDEFGIALAAKGYEHDVTYFYIRDDGTEYYEP